jgi:diadenosine tetraphosphate (Ap4A) HIT family hydrolase
VGSIRTSAATPVAGIKEGWNSKAFNFDQPGLEKERFWSGVFSAREASLFYNKFPFARLHALLVPDQRKCLVQFLEESDHQWAWRFAEQCAHLTGFGLGYNSFGAFASENHLHFHLLLESDSLPVTRPEWTHNGGHKPYPTLCARFDSCQNAWEWLSDVHVRGLAYNLLYQPGRVYCFPRKLQGTFVPAPWTSGFAYYEMAGAMIVPESQDYESLTEADIENEFVKLHP